MCWDEIVILYSVIISNFTTIDNIDYRRKDYSGTLAAITAATGLGLYSVQGGDVATTSNTNFISISQKCLDFMRIQGKISGGGNIVGIFGVDVLETLCGRIRVKTPLARGPADQRLARRPP